jgi:hypothetical protein
MSKAVKVFIIYIIFLLACSVVFNWLNISSDFQNIPKSLYSVRLILIPTVIGGFIALKQLVPPKPFKIFWAVYFSLWILRYLVLFIANTVGEVHLFNRTFRFDMIIANYYKTASRLETPLPFIIFWLIFYFYTRANNPLKTDKEV